MSDFPQCQAAVRAALQSLYAADEALITGDTRAAILKLEVAQAALAEARKLLPPVLPLLHPAVTPIP